MKTKELILAPAAHAGERIGLHARETEFTRTELSVQSEDVAETGPASEGRPVEMADGGHYQMLVLSKHMVITAEPIGHLDHHPAPTVAVARHFDPGTLFLCDIKSCD